MTVNNFIKKLFFIKNFTLKKKNYYCTVQKYNIGYFVN